MAFQRGFALIIGVGQYQHAPEYNVPQVVGDARAVDAVLRDPQHCGYPDAQVRLLIDAQATRDAQVAALEQLRRDVEAARQAAPEPVTVLLFYCGHGMLDADGAYYLSAHDSTLADGQITGQSGIRQDRLLALIRAIPAQRMLLIFNACFAGSLSPGSLDGPAAPEPPAASSKALPDALAGALLSAGEGRIIITACREEQKAYFLKQAQTTIFGEKLVAALRGEEIVPRKGAIGVYDLYAYLYDTVSTAVQRLLPEPQEPELTVSKGVGVMAVALYNGRQPTGDLGAGDRPDLQRLGKAVREVDAETSRRLFQQVITLQIGQLAAGNLVGRDLFQVGRDLVRGDQYNIGQYIVSSEADEITPQPDVLTRDYIQRPDAEQMLSAALSEQDDTRPTVILYGAPGTGRSALAAAVSTQLFPERFPGGVLSVSMAGLSRLEVLHALLSQLGRRWYDPGEQQLDAGKLWNRLHARDELARREGQQGRATLVIVDDVDRPADLASLQPSFPTRSRLLAVSGRRLESPKLQEARRCRLGPLTLDQARAVFAQFLGGELVKEQAPIIDAIALHRLLLPTLIRDAARSMRDDALPPALYLRQLRQESLDQRAETGLVDAVLTQALEDLSPAQQRLLTLANLFGEHEWTAESLAAIALVPNPDVLRELRELQRRDLVQASGAGFRLEGIYRRASARLFAGWSPYEREAAWRQLARYCLDGAQDLAAELRASFPQGASTLSIDYRKQFQRGLRPRMQLIKQVFEYATAQRGWWIVERLAALPYVSYFQRLIVTGALVSLEAVMATVEQLHVTRRRSAASTSWIGTGNCGAFGALGIVHSRENYVVLAEEGVEPAPIIERLTTLVRADSSWSASSELYLSLYASQVLGAIVVDVDLVDGRLFGVRGERMAWSTVNMTGARFASCAMARSYWHGCDASQAAFTQTNLSGGLLRNMRLRGADLSGANLAGALLDDVDLHGASLRGANLAGAVLRNVRLVDAELDGVDWTGAQIEPTVMLDATALRELRRLVGTPVGLRARASLEDLQDLGLTEGSLAGANLLRSDLRQADLRGADLQRTRLGAADLSGANLAGADLRGAELADAKLGGAILTGADLRDSALRGADLRGAIMIGARLQAVSLVDTRLTGAFMMGAELQGANLKGVSLREATLTGADLRAADLTGADLREADLRLANLAGSFLYEARLNGADFSSADLAGARLRDADGPRAVFVHADLRDADLAGLTADGCDLTAAQVDQLQLVYLTGGGGGPGRPAFTLPSGAEIARLDGDYSGSVPAVDLTLATLGDGDFSAIDLTGQRLTGALLSGNFTRVQLDRADLRRATVSGNLTEIGMADADLRGATLSGNLTTVNLRGALLRDATLGGVLHGVDAREADLRGATLAPELALRFVDLRDAEGLDDAALRGVSSLRGSILPDGAHYGGQFDLPGDLASAREAGVDLASDADRQAFYAVRSAGVAAASQVRALSRELDLTIEQATVAGLLGVREELERVASDLDALLAADLAGRSAEREQHYRAALARLEALAAANERLSPLLELARKIE